MRTDQGFDILHNGVPRTFRDQKVMAYEAARFAKARNRADIRKGEGEVMEEAAN
jgi:hypothetical protein